MNYQQREFVEVIPYRDTLIIPQSPRISLNKTASPHVRKYKYDMSYTVLLSDPKYFSRQARYVLPHLDFGAFTRLPVTYLITLTKLTQMHEEGTERSDKTPTL